MLVASPCPETNMKRYSPAPPQLPPPPPPPMYGTGKRATTILADQGDYVHVISDVPYILRGRETVRETATAGPGGRARRGLRPMHVSTLGMKTEKHTDYTTTLQTYHGGNPCKPPPGVPPPYPSQHTSQIKLGANGERYWQTYYTNQYLDKGTERPSKLHYPSQLNKLNMNEGGDMRTILDTGDSRRNYRYWSQYNGVHGKLGAILGPGVQRERDVRTAYNPLTGEEKGSAWKEENRRVSGNRILYHGHRADPHFTLG